MIPSTTAWNKMLRTLLPPVFWLGVWQIGATVVGQVLLLPGPVTVAAAFLRLAETPAFWQIVLSTLKRILSGLVLGTVLGIVLAVLSCFHAWADAILSPAVRVIRATPVASFILLVMLWTKRDWVPTIIGALMVLPVIWSNVVSGIREVDGKLLELAMAYRFGRKKKLTLIYLPTVRPYFLSALTTSMGLAWKSGVAAEALCWPKLAIGTQIYNTKYYLETPDLFAWTLTVILLSLLLERLLSAALKGLNRGWNP